MKSIFRVQGPEQGRTLLTEYEGIDHARPSKQTPPRPKRKCGGWIFDAAAHNGVNRGSGDPWNRDCLLRTLVCACLFTADARVARPVGWIRSLRVLVRVDPNSADWRITRGSTDIPSRMPMTAAMTMEAAAAAAAAANVDRRSKRRHIAAYRSLPPSSVPHGVLFQQTAARIPYPSGRTRLVSPVSGGKTLPLLSTSTPLRTESSRVESPPAA